MAEPLIDQCKVEIVTTFTTRTSRQYGQEKNDQQYPPEENENQVRDDYNNITVRNKLLLNEKFAFTYY